MNSIQTVSSMEDFERLSNESTGSLVCVIKRQGQPPIVCYKHKTSEHDRMSIHIAGQAAVQPDRIVRYSDGQVMRYDDQSIVIADQSR